MNVIPRRWLWEGSWESRNLLCRRTEPTPQLKDHESMPNLMLSLGYHDFKTEVYNFLYELRLGGDPSIEKGRLSIVWVVGPLCLTYNQGIGALQMRKTEKRFTTEYFEDGHALQKRASGGWSGLE